MTECDFLTDQRAREYCRGERGTVEVCNHMRAGWGLPPLPADHQIPAPPPTAAPPEEPFPCVHRGEHLRSLGLKLLCGCDQRVYRCGLLGDCVRYRPPQLKTGAKLRAAISAQGLAICADCERREPPQ